MPAIRIDNLVKNYGEIEAVKGISLEIEKGEIFGLLGPNGAGKTTTLMILSTLLEPTSGHATVSGYHVMEQPADVRNSIGIVFQDPSSDDTLTGYENLKLHGLLYDVRDDLDKKIRDVLELVELWDRRDDLVKTYSGGMRRRLEIARGLLHEPAVLFLDEPTLGLDPQTREHIWEYIEGLTERTDMTVIITTHYMDEADRLCDRIGIIDHGEIVALDTPANLKKNVGGDIIHLKTDNGNMENIEKLKAVKKAERLDGEIRLTVEDAPKNLQAILKKAGRVESVEVRSPTLNDVFLHFTGRGIREEEGDELDRMRNFQRVRSQ